jgi:hypothetical protein
MDELEARRFVCAGTAARPTGRTAQVQKKGFADLSSGRPGFSGGLANLLTLLYLPIKLQHSVLDCQQSIIFFRWAGDKEPTPVTGSPGLRPAHRFIHTV